MKAIMPTPGPKYEATMQLLKTAEALWNGSRLFFERWDLSPSQFNVLNLLWGLSEGLSQVDVSRQLIMHRSNVTGLIDRLEKRGLVERQETPGDRRAYRVVLAPKGIALMEEVLPEYYAAAEEVWDELPLGEIQSMVRQLTEVAARAERVARKQQKERRL
jgi:MarR family 2-MHQ and catechol resistance regulon transcriptional repressor